jgi:small GTP-binding protein
VIQKKVCLLGAYGVGKTSLVARFVHSIFSEKYMTTVGVKIDKKTVALDGGAVDMVIWDIYGEDDFQKVRMSYLRGASGYLLVVDGTRLKSLDTALALQKTAEATVGVLPFVVVINKADLVEDWVFDDKVMETLTTRGWKVVKTSAKTGADVDETFTELAQAMVARV